jgi:hypothetical protein
MEVIMAQITLQKVVELCGITEEDFTEMAMDFELGNKDFEIPFMPNEEEKWIVGTSIVRMQKGDFENQETDIVAKFQFNNLTVFLGYVKSGEDLLWLEGKEPWLEKLKKMRRNHGKTEKNTNPIHFPTHKDKRQCRFVAII